MLKRTNQYRRGAGIQDIGVGCALLGGRGPGGAVVHDVLDPLPANHVLPLTLTSAALAQSRYDNYGGLIVTFKGKKSARPSDTG